MGDDDKPFSRPFEALKGLKSRLPKSRASDAEKTKPEAPEPAAAEEPEPPPEPSFEEAMEGWGVERLGRDRERVERQRELPSGGAPPTGAGPRRVQRGVRGAAQGFDESTPRIDLHGLSVDHALAELHRHLTAWKAGGVLRARIVTGRGAHSGDGVAAIREAVETRLLATAGVVGVYRADPAAGGEGVVLLELRGPGRRRPQRS